MIILTNGIRGDLTEQAAEIAANCETLQRDCWTMSDMCVLQSLTDLNESMATMLRMIRGIEVLSDIKGEQS